MKGYLGLQKIYLPHKCLETAFESFRRAGDQKKEGVALFAGIIQDASFFIQETIIPRHNAYNGEEGLFYEIGPHELNRLNKMLHTKGFKLIAQIHSHPGIAYHSKSDDEFAVITKVGGISIVVPNFGFIPVELHKCAIYRLSEQNKWVELSKKEIIELLIVK